MMEPSLFILVIVVIFILIAICSYLILRQAKKDFNTYGRVKSEWEIDRRDIVIGRVLGGGNFGVVNEGVWKKVPPKDVAVKQLIPGVMDRKEFLAEAEVMMKLCHPNIIKLYGISTSAPGYNEEPTLIVTERMKGSLLDYLRADGHCLQQVELFDMGAQVASGMCYLESMNYIHRDLAARNVLVGDGNRVKIADFGLARLVKEDVYIAKIGAMLPIKWTAPEAVTHKIFSIKSDVFSFGIFLYELFTRGEEPYPGMSSSKALNLVKQGYRMPCPLECLRPLYKIMLECWDQEPAKRPAFRELQSKLENFKDYGMAAY